MDRARIPAAISDAIVTLAVPTLPFRPVRVELVGSMVRGCAHLDSDLDLNLAAHDWNEQVEWRRIWNDPQHRLAFMAALAPLMNTFAVRIEATPNNPDQNTYDICYDFLSGTLVDPGDRFPDRTARWWNGYQMKWRDRPLMQREAEFRSDEWSGTQLAFWQAEYGERFLTYHSQPMLRADGSPVLLPDGGQATKLVPDPRFASQLTCVSPRRGLAPDGALVDEAAQLLQRTRAPLLT